MGLDSTIRLKLAPKDRWANRGALMAGGCILLLWGLLTGEMVGQQDALRTRILQTEINRLRYPAEEAVGRIEWILQSQRADGIDDIGAAEWRPPDWSATDEQEKGQYVAIVRRDGKIVRHSDAARQDRQLTEDWYSRVVAEGGEGVMETYNGLLAITTPAYNLRLPLTIGDREVGSYHTGLSTAWVEGQIQTALAAFQRYQRWTMGVAILSTLAGLLGISYLMACVRALRRQLADASLQRVEEVGRLVVVLAHEIRNPLHAIQLNLYSLHKHHERGGPLAAEEVQSLLQQSSREIRRIEDLIHHLVAFVSTEEPRPEVVDVTAELRAVIDFIEKDLVKKRIRLDTELPNESHWVRIDPVRFRQIVLNILRNAERSTQDGHDMRIVLTRDLNRVQIAIDDNGWVIPEGQSSHIFEPFHATKMDSAGLGLALVKRFVEEARGSVCCEVNNAGGTTFRVSLDAVSPANGRVTGQ